MKYRNYDITIAVTSRCNSRCAMCSQWANPTKPEEELEIDVLKKLPYSKFVQITGGELFVRTDIREIIALICKKAKRVLVNTNGYFTEKILDVANAFPQVAFRISIDGGKEIHNRIRGINIYDKAIQTIIGLKKLGVKDVGILFTLQDENYSDLLSVYHKSLELNVRFGCTIVHNSFYFSKDDNEIVEKNHLKEQMQLLVEEQLCSKRKNDWAKAFMNHYNISYKDGKTLPIKCDAGVTSFYIDAMGNVLPCNMTPEPWLMGNLKKETWDEIMQSDEAKKIIVRCKNCKIPCWSMCNVQTAIKKHFWIPAWWLVKNKFITKL